MKAKFKIVAMAMFAVSFFVSCEKMNDLHDKYLKDGPIIYVGKLDSLHAYPGHNRVQFDYWTTDPRARKVTFYWNNKKESATFDIPVHFPEEMQTVVISPVAEGAITFQAVTYDNDGHRSIVFERTVDVYGEKYIASMAQRGIKSATLSSGKLSIVWAGSSSVDEVGVEVKYYDLTSGLKEVFITLEDTLDGTIINNVDGSKEIVYRTAYKPDPASLDLFYTDYSQISH